MRNSIYLAAVCLSTSVFAQNQDQPGQSQTPQTQPPSTQRTQTAPPSTAPGSAPQSTTDRISQGLGNLFRDHRFEDLPPAVQKTVREQAGAGKIDDIDRETRTGRVVWEIEIEQDGRDREIHVADDGTLLPEGGVAGRAASDTAARTREVTGTGAAAGAQTGRSVFSAGPKWEELPQAVQQRAMQFGGKEKVADIDRETDDGRVEYEIEFRREGKNLEVEFAEDGTITESSDPAAAPVGASPSAASRSSVTTQPGQTSPQSPQSPQRAQPTPGQPNQPNQPRQ